MARKYPGVTSYADRHGRRRWRYRVGEVQRELGAEFGSVEFETRYAAAVAATRDPAPAAPKWPDGTFGALMVAFKSGREYAALAPATRSSYERFFNVLVGKLGALPCGDAYFQAHHAQALMDTIPGDAARSNFRKKLRVVFDFARRNGWRQTDPVGPTKSGYRASDGIAPWTAGQVAMVLARHPLGTPMGLALRLLAETGAALADVVRLGPADLSGSVITYKRKKLGKRSLPDAVCPLSPELLAALSSCTADTFLAVAGKPRSAAGLGNKVRAVAADCGFAGSAHGIRKARGNALYAAGADLSGVAAILGHSETKTTAHYVRAADRSELAKTAAQKTNHPADNRPNQGE